MKTPPRSRLVVALLVIFVVFGCGPAVAQQPYNALDHYTWHPGGTPEDELWQVLVLFGVGETTPALWNVTLTVERGKVLDLRACHRTTETIRTGNVLCLSGG